MDQDSPATVNDATRRLMEIEAMLKLVHPDKGGMMGSSATIVFDFLLNEMKERVWREAQNNNPAILSGDARLKE